MIFAPAIAGKPVGRPDRHNATLAQTKTPRHQSSPNPAGAFNSHRHGTRVTEAGLMSGQRQSCHGRRYSGEAQLRGCGLLTREDEQREPAQRVNRSAARPTASDGG
jgi:hypothetical protein